MPVSSCLIALIRSTADATDKAADAQREHARMLRTMADAAETVMQNEDAFSADDAEREAMIDYLQSQPTPPRREAN